MQHRIKTRFSIRLAGYAVTGAAVMGMIAAVSFAGVRPGQPLLRFGGNTVQPYVHQEDADKRDTANQGVYAPGAKPYGLGYGDWSALWWQRIFFIPPADNPNLDTSGADCAAGQAGPVWYLAGSFTDKKSFKRTCIIPSDVSLLIPILTTAFGAGLADCLSPGWGNAGPCDVNALRAAAAAEEDNPKTLDLSLDGVPQLGLNAYRVQSPVFNYTLTSSNIVAQLFNFPVPAGTYQPVVADGYWVMFKPLTPGVHFIHAKGVEAGGFTVEETYTLIVVGSH
jgi:hypothetical protein